MTEDITKERLKEILNILLESEGYHIANMKYKECICSELIGYGMSEHLENTAYFDGVTLEISKIKNRTRARANPANNFRICY